MQIRVNWRYTLTEEGLPLGIGVRFIVEPEHGTPWFFFNSSDNINIPSSLHVQVLVGVKNRGKEIEYEECDVGEIAL
ncbi:hypothetical protein DEO72_LG10g1131 [Vigna unguiculata]|uniref:Uncharacterized protein n=1 Tax=Vigna unguiculata TaxID=3917 RepID=A0A4D6N9E8_VIGUN|nr:hypothetical protein DEO72_LG10g1131 [Vigna unguiculata]